MNSYRIFIFRIILLLVIGLGFQNHSFAQEKVSLQDNTIGSTFKTLAKSFVVVMDIDKFKKDNINQINKLRPDKYKRKYAKVYEVIKDLPISTKSKYGIVEDMPREQLIKDIESLDKRQIYEAIDLIPNTIIAKEFKKYLTRKKQGFQESHLVKEVNEFWNKILGKPHGPMLKT
ncbi:MAG: hypothetical protein Q7S42_01730 [Candidatus Omnitrophota bacterium]|nr:hypothetical protein [Candidatus Omnitrophota bacterium]